MTHALILAAALASQCPGNACPTIPPARAAADDGVNALRARWGLPAMRHDARLDRAARFSLEHASRTGRVHMGMDDAARRAGIPDGPKPPGGVYRNFTEGWIGGSLADYLRAMGQIRAREPDEGHVVDFCNPHWTHYGFAEDGRGAVLWYAYLPGEVAPPATPPVRAARQAPPAVPQAPEEPGPYDHLLATAVYLSTGSGSGTGVIVRSARAGAEYVNTVLTVAHVVAAGNVTVRATEYTAGQHSGSAGAFAAEVVRLDRQTDAAVVRFRSPGPMPVAALDWKPRRFKVGQPVCKVGFGLNLPARLDIGIISHARAGTSISTVPCIRLSCVIHPGDSGGPVFRDGKLIGLSDSANADTIGYALPVAAAFTPEDLK
jgi:hypothetical protein